MFEFDSIDNLGDRDFRVNNIFGQVFEELSRI